MLLVLLAKIDDNAKMGGEEPAISSGADPSSLIRRLKSDLRIRKRKFAA
jgi:hypothetical protein